MSANLEQKKLVVKEIKDKLEKASTVILVDYQGLNVEQSNKLRSEFSKSDAEYKVYKNRLLKRAFDELNIEGFDDYLKSSTAVAFGYSEQVAPAKIIVDTIKENKKMSVKAGMLDGKIINNEDIKQLADLPPRDVLIAQLLGMLNAPMSGFARVINAPMGALARGLNAVAQKGD